MSEAITKKEKKRRLGVVIACVVLDTLALTMGIFGMKEAGDLEQKTNQALRQEIEAIRGETALIQQNYVDFSRSIGWNISARGTTDRHASTGVRGEPLKSYLELWRVNQLEKEFEIKDFTNWGQQGSGSPLYLTTLFDKIRDKEREFVEKSRRVREEIARAEGEAKTISEELRRTEDQNLSEIQQLSDKLKNDRTNLAVKERQHAEELNQLEAEVYEKQQKLTDLKNAHLQDLAREQERFQELVRRINWIHHRREEAKERKEPDGTILSVDHEDAVAYIDLVHSDRLFKGTKFKVYSLEKGGVKVDKGEVEVVDVRASGSSRCAILKTYDKAEPLAAGDRIYNEFYEKGQPRRIAFAGRLTGKLSNDEAARRIREFGDVYQDRVDERTNYLVIGEGFAGPDGEFGTDETGRDDHPNFKLALEWGVKILLERHLHDYLGVP